MKKIVLIITLLVILVSIPTSVILVKKTQELRSKAAPATVLSLEPATATKNIDQTFTVNVHINSGGNMVVSSDIVLNYNPQVLEGVSVTMGTFLANATKIQENINNQTGKIIYSFYTINTNAKSGEGTLLTVSFKGKSAGTSTISFDPQSAIGALQEQSNVLNNTIPGSYTIAGGTGSPTPTPTPPGGTASPTPSPTPGASATPTPRASATPSPSPTASPTPTPGGQGGPVSTPTPTPSSITSVTTISSPPVGATVTTAKPTITGKTVSGATVTITINSPTITTTVTADVVGNWSYTPTTALVDGTHTVTITAKDPNTGQTVSKTSSFVVAVGQGAATTGGEIVAGNSLPTLFILGVGLLLLILSLVPKVL